MTKRKLINRVAINAGLSKVKTKEVVELWMNELLDQITEEGRLELRGFGVFTVDQHGGYTTVNPQTGKRMEIKPTRQVHFKASKALKARLNEDD